MASRISTRLQHSEPPAAEVPPSSEVSAGVTISKTRAPKSDDAAKKNSAKSAVGDGKRRSALAAVLKTPSKDALSSLTPELLYMVLDNIKDSSTIGRLARTSKLYYSIMMPLLHKRLAVAAPYHAHIAKLIRTLEPYLTITQKRLLKAEGKYKGQQERYSSDLDVNEVPTCASYDNGNKHCIAQNPGSLAPQFESFMKGFPDLTAKDEVPRHREFALTALRSLSLCGMSFDNDLTSPLQQAVDLMALKELTIHGQELDAFLLRLADLARLSSNKKTKISLRSLSLDMGLTDQSLTSGQVRGSIVAATSFISAFDTLTSLEIKNFQHHKATTVGPLTTVSLIEAVANHKNLRSLRFTYAGMSSEWVVLFLRANSVAIVIDNCPHLQELEFAPQESEMASLYHSSSLIHTANTSCFPYDSWLACPQPENCQYNIMSCIIKAYLSRDCVQGSKPFIWEDHFKLKHISVPHLTWDIASKFGKSKKGMKKAEPIQSDDGQRAVMCRDVSGVAFHGNMYAPSTRWLDKVENYKS
ncbi:hypothetical protein FKW77_001758 [Venturia effusa]|uniref:Uncharacterized protein n=1 Tax=Venturia effusa TaxID=50376 RepID=A0A517L8P6_9PEZI|nr:hypothetical protein FKW77_001758 [Venturia effusa]